MKRKRLELILLTLYSYKLSVFIAIIVGLVFVYIPQPNVHIPFSLVAAPPALAPVRAQTGQNQNFFENSFSDDKKSCDLQCFPYDASHEFLPDVLK